jgi:RNA polymerase sigma factor (sigma-70 family)
MASCRPSFQVPALTDDLSDAELIALCRQGRAAAWSTLVRRYQRLVYTVPRRAGLSEDAAADVFQICFSKLHEHLDRLTDASRVRAWLVTTARRETLQLLEDARRMPAATGAEHGADGDDEPADPLAQLADPDPLPEELLSTLQQQHRLRQAVDLLDPRARQFVELMFLREEPASYQEISATLGIAEGSIGPTRARCLQKLRQILDTLA